MKKLGAVLALQTAQGRLRLAFYVVWLDPGGQVGNDGRRIGAEGGPTTTLPRRTRLMSDTAGG